MSGNATGGHSSHPPVPVARHEIIDHIAERDWHQHTEVIQEPPPGELSQHPERRRGLGRDMTFFQQEEGLIVRGGQIQISKDALRRFGLECPELELPGS